MKSSRISVIPLQTSRESHKSQEKTPPGSPEGRNIGKTLFEEFFIIGVERDDVTKLDTPDVQIGQKWFLDPKVLYSYPRHESTREWYLTRL
jgi:hypothetical protein